MKKTKICPICRNEIKGHPAISRKDNKTEICSACGTKEAVYAFLSYYSNYKGGEK